MFLKDVLLSLTSVDFRCLPFSDRSHEVLYIWVLPVAFTCGKPKNLIITAMTRTHYNSGLNPNQKYGLFFKLKCLLINRVQRTWLCSCNNNNFITFCRWLHRHTSPSPLRRQCPSLWRVSGLPFTILTLCSGICERYIIVPTCCSLESYNKLTG